MKKCSKNQYAISDARLCLNKEDSMKYLLIFSLLTSTAFAGETWDKAKDKINNTAEKTESKTREIINKGKEKWNERQEEKQREEERDERAEFERLKKKYGYECTKK